jgi:hypothetical protein
MVSTDYFCENCNGPVDHTDDCSLVWHNDENGEVIAICEACVASCFKKKKYDALAGLIGVAQ